ncbi:uncharacterized protein FOMMEDRAFT_171110, partial [Fomitiporia mediterranea MF3/22]|uniref:uncharacterized protein n=1 Tax=Fomitiporia mediterranea (strain MF3/22) TaxID=694068 RepID=UPI0004409749
DRLQLLLHFPLHVRRAQFITCKSFEQGRQGLVEGRYQGCGTVEWPIFLFLFVFAHRTTRCHWHIARPIAYTCP